MPRKNLSHRAGWHWSVQIGYIAWVIFQQFLNISSKASYLDSVHTYSQRPIQFIQRNGKKEFQGFLFLLQRWIAAIGQNCIEEFMSMLVWNGFPLQTTDGPWDIVIILHIQGAKHTTTTQLHHITSKQQHCTAACCWSPVLQIQVWFHHCTSWNYRVNRSKSIIKDATLQSLLHSVVFEMLFRTKQLYLRKSCNDSVLKKWKNM